MKRIIGTLIGIGLLLLSGCATAAPPPTATPVPAPTLPPTATPVPTPTPVPVLESAEDLIGIWHQTPTHPFAGEIYQQYKEDGTYRTTTGAADRLESHPLVEGEFWFEGKQLLVKDTAGIPDWDVCVKSQQIGKYEVQVLANGNIKIAKIEDECSGRVLVLPAEYEQVP